MKKHHLQCLEGIWVHAEEGYRLILEITTLGERPRILSFDRYGKLATHIRNVRWDGTYLQLTLIEPSTKSRSAMKIKPVSGKCFLMLKTLHATWRRTGAIESNLRTDSVGVFQAKISRGVQKLEGKWENNDSNVIYNIAFGRNTVAITSYDKEDGERSKISKVTINGNTLNFEAYTKSTKYRVLHQFRAANNNRILQLYTVQEPWRKICGVDLVHPSKLL